MKKLIILLIASLMLPICVLAGDFTTVMDNARQQAKSLTLPENRYKKEGMKAARESAELFHSDAFQKKLKCEEQRLAEDAFSEHTRPWKQKQSVQESSDLPAKLLAENEQVYLLFSSSVPLETMQAYISDIAGTGTADIQPILRGWVGGLTGTEKDVEYFSSLLQKDTDCEGLRKPCQYFRVNISLKPSVFAQYDVTRVPAVVYVHRDSAITIQGDAGLDYLLERINREAGSPGLDNLIEKLRRS